MRFAADFQSMNDRDGLTVTFGDLLDAPAAAVLVGGRILLDDLEGHRAEATVTAVDEGIIDVVVDLATWNAATSHWEAQLWAPGYATTGWNQELLAG